MGFMDKLRNGGNKSATLPRGAKVVRRRRRSGGGTDTGYWYNSQFFLIDGTLTDSYDYTSGQGEVLTTSEARTELSESGYDANSYTAPSSNFDSADSGRASTSYDSSPPSYDSPPASYSSPPPSYDSSPPSPSTSYDSGSW